MEIVLQILMAILVFGLLIFVHELGHFTVGKLSGMRVNEFAIGMGPAIWSKQKGETKYALRLFPIGGYCAVEGEDEDSDDSRAFSRIKLWKRVAFVCAGAFMNLVLGLVILGILVSMRSSIPTTVVDGFYESSVSSEQLMVGDQILSINGVKIFTANDISFSLISDRDGFVDFTVLRDGQKVKLNQVNFGMQLLEDGTKVIKGDFYVHFQEKTAANSIQYTFTWMFSLVRQVWLSLINLLTGKFVLSDLSGPVGITAAIGQAAKLGLNRFLEFVALITINIGAFNLLPVPALDGGRLIFLLIEAVRRRPVNPKYEGAIHAAGFILLMGLVVFATINDISRW